MSGAPPPDDTWPPRPPPPATPAAAASDEVAPAALRTVVDELRAGVALVRAGRFQPPPATARLRRLFYPLGVVVALWRAMWSDEALRRKYLRAMAPQAVLTVVGGAAWAVWIQGVDTRNFKYEDGNFSWSSGERMALSAWGIVIAVYTTMCVFEWIIIALTREHHDAMSYEVSTAVGVPPEERIERPRVRVDVQWLVTKMKRRIQAGIILLVCVVPAAVLMSAVAVPTAMSIAKALGGVAFGNTVANVLANLPSQVLLTAVGGYWLGVFTLGKTAHAWRDEIVADPFFLRGADALADRFPRLFGWLHLYARVLRRVVALVRRPASVVEHATWETAGLVALRVLISLPGVYVLLRPLVPVAATVVIAARSPETLKGLPVSIVLDERTQ